MVGDRSRRVVHFEHPVNLTNRKRLQIQPYSAPALLVTGKTVVMSCSMNPDSPPTLRQSQGRLQLSTSQRKCLLQGLKTAAQSQELMVSTVL